MCGCTCLIPAAILGTQVGGSGRMVGGSLLVEMKFGKVATKELPLKSPQRMTAAGRASTVDDLADCLLAEATRRYGYCTGETHTL